MSMLGAATSPMLSPDLEVPAPSAKTGGPTEFNATLDPSPPTTSKKRERERERD